MSKEIIPSPGGSNKFSRLISKIKAALGIVENDNTASHTIASGKFVTWKGDLYKAKSAIPSGTTLSSSNLQAVSEGGLNELSEQIGKNHVYYNADTDGSVESNRTSAMDYIIANLLDDKSTTTAVVRYSGGYYFTYIFFGKFTNVPYAVVEFAHNVTEKIIYWQKGSSWGKVFAIS